MGRLYNFQLEQKLMKKQRQVMQNSYYILIIETSEELETVLGSLGSLAKDEKELQASGVKRGKMAGIGVSRGGEEKVLTVSADDKTLKEEAETQGTFGEIVGSSGAEVEEVPSEVEGQILSAINGKELETEAET